MRKLVQQSRLARRDCSRPPTRRLAGRGNGILRPGVRRRPLAAALVTTVPGTVAAEEFYLRAGVGLDRPADAAFCLSASPDALYGCGSGGDGAPRRSLGGFGTVTGVELGLGLNAGPAVRIEAQVDHRPRLAFEGRANFLAPERRQSVSADLSVLSGMVAAHVDLSALGLPRLGPFDRSNTLTKKEKKEPLPRYGRGQKVRRSSGYQL